MTNSQKIILTVLSVIACVLVFIVGHLAIQTYQEWSQRPLGPALSVATTPITGTLAPLGSAYSSTLAPTLSFGTTEPQPVCGGPKVMTILAIGMDRYGNTDIMRVVRADFVTPKVTMLEFPRDLWVKVPYIADKQKGLDHAKLNMAYYFGDPKNGFWNDPSGGAGLLSLTLDLNFGVRANNYVVVNMITFQNIVDAVGGVDINVPDLQTQYDTGKPIGNHHLDGPQALAVARNRKDGVFARASNQNLVLCALRKKLLSPNVVTQIPSLINSFKDNIQTDFTPEQISQLACLGTKLPRENIGFASFPENLFTDARIKPDPYFGNPNGTFVWSVDFNILRDYVTRFNAGTWPGPSRLTPTPDKSSSYCQ